MHGKSPLRAVLLSVLCGAIALPSPARAQQPVQFQPSDLEAFAPRPIGPAVTGGRVHDLEALPDDPSTLFVATASGGLWKTTNRGHTWRNVFENMPVSTFGDVAIALSNPAIMYAGTGEQNNRQSTSWGNGVYRSEDGGETWTHVGLEETRHIGKIEVHPSNPDVAYVAALGNLWAPNPERGVFRTTDGGQTWERILYVDENTGAVDLVMNPRDPGVLYAATYQRQRRAWGFNGGGPGSGIHMTTDGGDHWVELTRGIPDGDKGRIGLAISHSNPRVLNALIEHAEESGTYRSENGGMSWEKVNNRNSRPMYYSEIFIDPTNENRVYTLATSSFKSEDGGRTFEEIAARPSYDVGVHADHHALWIDPANPNHLFLAGDAGLHETYDTGVNFRKINNFDIGQFYGIGVDMRDPYYVYGGMQDNHSWMGPSQTRRYIGIVGDDWEQIGFGDGMYWQIDPTSPRYAYGNSQNGNYVRFDALTGDMLDIRPTEPVGAEEEYRWDWVSPSLVSRHDPSTVYVGGNRLFTSRDRGVSWEATEDLTRQMDREELEIMGVPGRDVTISKNDGTSSNSEITVIAESPLHATILWVGTDDGNVQVSRDGGLSWTEVARNVDGVADGTYVSRIVASAAGPGVAYVAFDAHRDGDFDPYVFKTEDFGTTWMALHGDPLRGSVNAMVEHPDNPNVLFLGTEHHMYVTGDAGGSWTMLANLPTTHYDDILIHPREKDLVLGTHGRSIWILDDTRPFAEWSESEARAAHLFSARPGTIFQYRKDTSYRAQAEFHGRNPDDGVYLTYRLAEGSEDVRMAIRNAAGDLVREMAVPGSAGAHRLNWDLRHGHPDVPLAWEPWDHPQLPRPVETRGPFVSPGTYTVTLEANGASSTTEVEVRGDPEMPITQAQYEEREAFLVHLMQLGRQLDTMLEGASGEEAGALRALRGIVRSVYGSLNGNGVRPGSLYPPTATHREQIRSVEEALNGV
jgi:photosystem II stability/assembly factor-like uncharacterized protein